MLYLLLKNVMNKMNKN